MQEGTGPGGDLGAALYLIPSAILFGLAILLGGITAALERRVARDSLRRHENASRLAEEGGLTPEQYVAFLQQEKRDSLRRRRDIQKLVGLVLAAAGVATILAFRVASDSTWLPVIGYLPLAVGLALLVYAFTTKRGS